MRKFNKKIFSLAAIIGLGTITTCSTVITSCGASEAKNLTIDGVPTVIGTIINNAGSWSNSFKLLKEKYKIPSSKLKDIQQGDKHFNDYRKKLNYVKNINYEDTISAIKMVIAMLEEELVVV